MNLLRKLLKPASRPVLEHDDAPSAVDPPAPACTWFDSSHDLKHGLEVTELDTAHAWPDTLPAAWPLPAMASSLQPA